MSVVPPNVRRALRSRITLGVLLILPLVMIHFGMRGEVHPVPSNHHVVGEEPLLDNDEVVLGTSHIFEAADKRANHTYLSNGLLVPNPKAQHPIYDLIHRAAAEWDAKLGRASKTLEEAVIEYRKRYGRAPPKGFDKWWQWAQDNNVQLPDEYDQIRDDLEPFWGISPSDLRKARDTVAGMEGMYKLSCRPVEGQQGVKCTYHLSKNGVTEQIEEFANERSRQQLELLAPIEGGLEPVDVVFYVQDVPFQFVGHDYKTALQEAAATGEYDTKDVPLDMTHLGWASTCAPHNPLRESYNTSILPDLDHLWNSRHQFVWDPKIAMDPCRNPTLVHLIGFLNAHGRGPAPAKTLYPAVAMSKTTLHSDILAVSPEMWAEEFEVDPEWDDKPHNKLIWRGKTTGIYYNARIPWNLTQRVSLVSHTARKEGSLPVLELTSQGEAVGDPVQHKYADLNEYMDVAFVDEPVQCEKSQCDILKNEYHFGDRMNWAQSNQYKYQLDVDGNGWSARFKRLLSTNSCILKSTIFPEWYTDRIQPWLHYIPLKPDLTDLYDIMSFFHGGHDDAAKHIASSGKEWSRTFWRKDDMSSYQFRLFLELARLQSDDREAMSFHLPNEKPEMEESASD